MKKNDTHIIFDGKKIMLSPNMHKVATFLMEIEKEIEILFSFQEKIENLKEYYKDILDMSIFLVEKMKDHDIDFTYKMKTNPENFSKELTFNFPVRSIMIVVFANIEVLYFFYLAYEMQICDEKEIKKAAKESKNLNKFLNKFLLNENNVFYKKNKKRFSKLDCRKIRDLRNSLTHFFSLSKSGLSVVPKDLEKKARKLENILKNNKGGHIIFISPEELYELVKAATILMISSWSHDFQEDKEVFSEKMSYLINLVENNGAVLVSASDVRI